MFTGDRNGRLTRLRQKFLCLHPPEAAPLHHSQQGQPGLLAEMSGSHEVWTGGRQKCRGGQYKPRQRVEEEIHRGGKESESEMYCCTYEH